MQAVATRQVKIVYVRSKLQLADLLTKAFLIALFQTLRSIIMGWWIINNNITQRECDNTAPGKRKSSKELGKASKRVKP
jgi:hypothetical protein